MAMVVDVVGDQVQRCLKPQVSQAHANGGERKENGSDNPEFLLSKLGTKFTLVRVRHRFVRTLPPAGSGRIPPTSHGFTHP